MNDVFDLQATLKELFVYIDGVLVRKVRTSNRTKVGDVVGSKGNHGYLATTVAGKKYLVHRLIWTYFFGAIPKGFQVDHINRDREDNTIENLRVVTHQENCFNHGDVKGCCYNKRANKWVSYIQVDNKMKWLGYYDTEAEAHDKYIRAKEVLHIIKDRT